MCSALAHSPDDATLLRELKEAKEALDAATRACDEALRAWRTSPMRWDRRALEAAVLRFIDAQRRLALAQAAARRVSARQRGMQEKAWGSH